MNGFVEGPGPYPLKSGPGKKLNEVVELTTF